MRKDLVLTLKSKAEEIAKNFSNPERDFNHTGEIFSVKSIKPLSENTAIVTFEKIPTNKLAVAFLFYVKEYWMYFFPTDSHILGMDSLGEELRRVEEYNFKLN